MRTTTARIQVPCPRCGEGNVIVKIIEVPQSWSSPRSLSLDVVSSDCESGRMAPWEFALSHYRLPSGCSNFTPEEMETILDAADAFSLGWEAA